MDDVIWGVLDKKFCSFKSSVGDQSKTEAFCRHKMNVTGICSKMTCPLANSRYATVREENGRCYLYMKTIERAHLPSKLWEKIRLSRNYRQALAKVDEEMQYFPKMLRHKAKQRLTKIHQYLLRMRKLRLADRPKMVRINRKRERRDKRREAKAEMAAKIEAGIKKSLLARAKTGMYKDILNFPQSDFDRALDDVGAKEDELDEGSDWDQVDEFEEGEEEDEEELEVEYADELDESDMEDFGEEWGGDGDDDDDDDDDDIDVPEEVEELLDILLTGLRDSDTIVRWSAAKGVGRLTGRLPRLLADDVVLSVLELLDDAEGEGAWHGGCLALAELARRGLLLPARLPQVVPVVRRALVYDVRKGSHSVGADVRDAACYVCWAFARAYAPAVMAPFVRTLSQGMLVTAVFDRQVNCRRAASAAFQENVGRQGHGNFPNGISILTAADYFTLGNRVKAYTEISVYIAQFPAYRTALLEHLLDAKLCHWDVALRQLAAQTLHNMAPLAPGWMVDVALPTLVPATLSTDLLLRHGATLAVAELLRALAKIPVQLPADLMKAVRNIVPRVEKARLYRGRGGHLMRAAVCRLIECLALAGHALSRRAVLRYWKSLDETMKHPDEEIKAAAVAALRALSRAHTSYVDDALVDRVVRSYVKTLRTDDNPGARRGFTLALGALAPQLLLESSDALASAVDVLTHCAIKDEDAETRRNALQALREDMEALSSESKADSRSDADRAAALKEEGNAAFRDRRWAAAEAAYSAALDVLPSAALYSNRAAARLQLRRFELADADCRAGLAGEPDAALQAKLLARQAAALVGAGRAEDALRAVAAAEQLRDAYEHPKLADWKAAAEGALAAGRRRTARDDAKEAAANGDRCLMAGDAADAINYYEQAERIPEAATLSTYHLLLVNHAVALNQLSREEEALALCEKATAAKPDYEDSWALQAQLQIVLHRYVDATATLLQACPRFESSVALHDRLRDCLLLRLHSQTAAKPEDVAAAFVAARADDTLSADLADAACAELLATIKADAASGLQQLRELSDYCLLRRIARLVHAGVLFIAAASDGYSYAGDSDSKEDTEGALDEEERFEWWGKRETDS
eukprot:PLAT12492.33.p1 GENE.PLAT12492.33~~PLAT12492.33.p1  ORF type:complete len:1099 (-),score=495.96 PLAT12492.33:1951-5247(-)